MSRVPIVPELAFLACVLLLGTHAAAQIFPPAPYPPGNSPTPDKVLLGKALFWDEQMSSTRTMACGTCHRIGIGGGADPRGSAIYPGLDGLYGTDDDVHGSFGVVRQDVTGHYIGSPEFGIDRQVTHRNAPTLINKAWVPEVLWDGRVDGTFRDPMTNQVVLATGAAIETVAAAVPTDTLEVCYVGRTWPDFIADLQNRTPLAMATGIPPALQAFVAGRTYAQLFAQVYGSPGITPARFAMAVASYIRSLVSDQSPYDRWLIGQYTMTPVELQGAIVFGALCANCHTDISPAVLVNGPVTGTFRNTGVRPIAEDVGRFVVTQQPADRGRFKVPGLRNVALRGPHFHNGGQETLTHVVEFYARGGDFHVNQDPLMFNIIGALSPTEVPKLVAFLNTLTDPRVLNELPPFDRPQLWSEWSVPPLTFGTGTAGTGGLVPRASAESSPYIGNPTFTLGVDRSVPGALPFVVFDFVASHTPTTVLGHAVYLAQTLAMTPIVAQPLLGSGPGSGFGSFVIGVPNDPGLSGLSLFGQWLIVDPAGPQGFSSSNAFEFTLF